MTRTTKANDLPHNNPEVAALMTENQYPKFFAKNGFVDVAPQKVKKEGGGRGNWGHPGDELEDLEEFNMTRPRRYSNTSPTHSFQLKSKFEAPEEDPLYDEERHGPTPEERSAAASVNGNGVVVADEVSTLDSAAAGSSGSGEAFRP
ncbi:hypothetical protein H072_1984 [Dactylellina haptotyla CBS 200.50]|uniref:Hyaluronan/mRNA-binding protein domain-containing protein n=1 Tax=Dactylellina haptotyla (strain CBS 200.50) TaxID=1284197 RepID=S8AM53_DACHA|nr:hypothetical protein H072_1984 [Dactylellina haptotyla CBS 200.50]